MATDKSRAAGHIFALLTVLFWGSTFICTKVLLDSFSAVQILVARFLIAYAACWVVRPKWIKPVIKDELGFLALGVLGDSLYSLMENVAIDLSTASNVSILVTVAPVFTLILAHIFTKDEKANAKLAAGSVIAFLGVVLVVLNGSMVLKLGAWGDLLAIGAALCWAVYSIIVKLFVDRFDPIVLTRKMLFYGALTAIPMALIEGKPVNLAAFLEPGMLVSILVLGLLGSCVCFILWNGAIKRLGVITTSNYIYFIPFVTVAVAAIVLKERITAMALIGAVLIISGVVFCTADIKLPWKRKKPPEDGQPAPEGQEDGRA